MVSGIILAAGFSKRMGENKLLLQLEQMTMIEKVICAAIESFLDEVILVYSHEAVKAIAVNYSIKTIKNENAKIGQSASVVKGVRTADPRTNAFLFMVGDQPFLNSSTINAILACRKKNPEQIIVPTYDGKNGNPVLFPSFFKNDLLMLRGDSGGKAIVGAAGDRVIYIAISKSDIGYDVDTREDFYRVKARFINPYGA